MSLSSSKAVWLNFVMENPGLCLNTTTVADGVRRPMGEYQLVVLRPAEPAVAQLRAALDNSPSVIYLKDTDGRYLLVNRAFARLHGRPPEELVGRTVVTYILPASDQHPEEVLSGGRADRGRARADACVLQPFGDLPLEAVIS